MKGYWIVSQNRWFMKTKHTPRDPMTPKKSQEFRASRVFPRRTKKRTNIDWPTACTVCGPFYLSQGWKSFSKRSFLSIVILHSAMHFTLFFGAFFWWSAEVKLWRDLSTLIFTLHCYFTSCWARLMHMQFAFFFVEN